MSRYTQGEESWLSPLCRFVPALERNVGISGLADWSFIGLVCVVGFLLRENQYRICEEFRDGSLHFDLLLTNLDLFRVFAGADLALNEDRLTFLQVLGNLLAEVAPHDDAMP